MCRALEVRPRDAYRIRPGLGGTDQERGESNANANPSPRDIVTKGSRRRARGHPLGPLLGGGVLLNGWFNLTMRRADTPVDPRKPVSKLTTEGPFRYTCNPAYLSLTMVYAGIALLRNALWAILLLPLVLFAIQRDQIEREERYLERTFGEEYLAYKERVRRWV